MKQMANFNCLYCKEITKEQNKNKEEQKMIRRKSLGTVEREREREREFYF